MTKSLTEKWKNGDLSDEGVYYWRIPDGQELIKNKLEMYAYRLCSNAEKIECLAPVPSYEEYKKLKEQLEEANAIIKDMRPFIKSSMQRQTFMRIINYENKWGVK